MKTELNLFEHSYSLFRFPKLNNEQLQAWDAGDEYLIQHFEELKLPAGSRILILNDSFGALSCWFSEQHQVTTISDSFISHQGIKHNLALNHCKPIDLRTSTDEWPQQVDIVLMQIPRNNRYLTWQLNQIALKYRDNCSLIAVNKAKEIHSSTLKIFEKYAGHTTTSLAWKKHRLVFSELNSAYQETIDPYTTWPVAEHKLVLSNLPNVYSGESLDLGARFILEHLKSNTKYQDIVDLGCGNGVLTLKLKQLNPQANITAIDESFMAVKSAHHNLTLNNIALDGLSLIHI